jgi:mRNA degradation ribonuclease J1/J2
VSEVERRVAEVKRSVRRTSETPREEESKPMIITNHSSDRLLQIEHGRIKALLKLKYVWPVHGDISHRKGHKHLSFESSAPPKQALLVNIEQSGFIRGSDNQERGRAES